MLALVYGLEKFHHYTFGRAVHIITDHKPLVAIAKKPLSKAPRRLQTSYSVHRSTDSYLNGSQVPQFLLQTLSQGLQLKM